MLSVLPDGECCRHHFGVAQVLPLDRVALLTGSGAVPRHVAQAIVPAVDPVIDVGIVLVRRTAAAVCAVGLRELDEFLLRQPPLDPAPPAPVAVLREHQPHRTLDTSCHAPSIVRAKNFFYKLYLLVLRRRGLFVPKRFQSSKTLWGLGLV